jgi:hypothetical protein
LITTTTVNDGIHAPNPVVLSMADNSTYTIDLTWTMSDLPLGEFDRYEVHMSSDPNFTPVSGTWITSITDIGITDYEVTGLSPETTYYFCIRVWDNDGSPGPFFADSNILEARTRGFNDPPDPVHLYDPENVTNCEADLTWTENLDSDFSHYEVHVSNASGFTPNAETMFGDPIMDQAELTNLVTGLCENTTFHFKIRVVDSGGLYADSNEVNCHTLDYLPDQLTLDDPFDIGIDSMNLSWTQSCITDFGHYEVHISETPGIVPGPSTLHVIIDNMTNASSWITGLAGETTYYFCIRHVDSAGNYMDSNEVFGTTLDGSLPRITTTAPFNGEIDVVISRDIVVAFSESMNTSSVSFFCDPDPKGWQITWSNGDSIVTYSHNDFDSETTYTFEILSGRDLAGNFLIAGSVPNPWTFTTVDNISPTIESIVPVQGTKEVPLDGAVVITFSESMDPDSIEFSCDPDPDGWVRSWNEDNTQLTLTHNDYSEVTTYVFEITQGTDVSGNPLVESDDSSVTFYTGDYTNPFIVITTPNNGDSDILPTTTVSVVFSEEMDKQSVLEELLCDFDYTASWNGYTLILTPTSELSESTLYTVTIPATAKDKAGNQIQEAYSFGFTTLNPDLTNMAPVVDVQSPNQDTAVDTFVILYTASDLDGDTLLMTIYYDNDNDVTNGGLTLIGSQLTNTGTHTWDVSELPEGDFYVYIIANDGQTESGSYSGLLTINRPDDPSDDVTDDVSDDVTDDGSDDHPGTADIKDSQSGDSFPWLFLWILLAIVLILILIGAMGYRNRKEKPGQVECQSCHKQFTPFNPDLSSVACTHCGEINHMK